MNDQQFFFLLTPGRVGFGLLVEHSRIDRRMPARQPGSGKAKGTLMPMLIPSRAPQERFWGRLCRARQGVGRLPETA